MTSLWKSEFLDTATVKSLMLSNAFLKPSILPRPTSKSERRVSASLANFLAFSASASAVTTSCSALKSLFSVSCTKFAAKPAMYARASVAAELVASDVIDFFVLLIPRIRSPARAADNKPPIAVNRSNRLCARSSLTALIFSRYSFISTIASGLSGIVTSIPRRNFDLPTLASCNHVGAYLDHGTQMITSQKIVVSEFSEVLQTIGMMGCHLLPAVPPAAQQSV